MRVLSALALACLITQGGLNGQEPEKKVPPDKALSAFDAALQLGEAKQTLALCGKLAKSTKKEDLQKKYAEWEKEYAQLEARIRTKAEKGEALGPDLEQSLRLLRKGLGEWSGDFLQGKFAERPQVGHAGGLSLIPPLPPGQNLIVTMDYENWLALQLFQQLAGHPQVQKMNEKMLQQMQDAAKGLDLNKPGALGEYFRRLGENAAENARKGGQPQTQPKKN